MRQILSSKLLWSLIFIIATLSSFSVIYLKFRQSKEGQADKVASPNYAGYEQASARLEKEIKRLEQENSPRLAERLLETAGFYRDWSKYEISEKYYRQVLCLDIEKKNQSLLGRDYNNLGVVNYLQSRVSSPAVAKEKSDLAKTYYQKAKTACLSAAKFDQSLYNAIENNYKLLLSERQ